VHEVIIIGAGPCGLAAAAACKRRGFEPFIIEKYHLVSSIYRYPTYMVFHSTPELLEIGGLPFSTPHDKPTRQEGLAYYRRAAQYFDLSIESGQTVIKLTKQNGRFKLEAVDQEEQLRRYSAKHVIAATGYFDQPNRLGILGEDLPKVSNYYREGHPYFNKHTAVIGGRNNALEAAMDLQRSGAKVTVIYRGSELSDKVKAWIKPVFQSAIDKGWIRMLWNSRVTEIHAKSITIETEGQREVIENDAVFSLVGYKPHHELLQLAGVNFQQGSGIPEFNALTMETNVEGLYVAGVAAGGHVSNDIFIENGRFHGEHIAKHLASKMTR
jgi:thioredoxin reductase (NADPH)